MIAGAWLALTALLALGSLVAWVVPAFALDWQPGLAVAEPWRCWTAAFVHWSPLHLAANLAAAAVVAALGHAAELPRALALAWFAAWPLTHLSLLVEPGLAHYGGLSGVLHAGVAVAAVALGVCGQGRRRVVGVLIGLGLAVKIGLERPWAEPLRRDPGWDIAIAPLAHAGGALAGFLCALCALAALRRAP